MTKNMGSIDRIVRVTLAGLVTLLYYANVISGTTAIILLVLATIFVLTSIVSFCPLYLPFGLSTLRKKIHGKH